MRSKELATSFAPPPFPHSYLLSFEGIEGAGKSTQIRKLKNYLEEKKFRVLILREPGGTSFGEKLRQAILNSKTPLHPVAELHLFASSRAQLLEEVTLKELKIPNTVIIYDRYIDSSLAYQGEARGLGSLAVLQAHLNFPLTIVPHRTFYLKISAHLSTKRQEIRNQPQDYFERRGEEFYEKLISGYDKAIDIFQERIKLIDASQDIDSIHQEIIFSTEELLGRELHKI